MNKEDSIKALHKSFDYENAKPLLEVSHLKQYFRFTGGPIGGSKYLKAVHDVSFKVYKGEVFGLVGESGCGKTTTGRSIMKLYDITSGDVWLDGIRISAGTRWNEKEIKWTNIRAKDAIKALRLEENENLKALLAAYESKWGEKKDLKSIRHELADESIEFYQEKKAILDDFEAKNAILEKKIKETSEEAKRISEEQIEKIKEAKRDNRNYNKNIALEAEKEVETKYQEFLLSIQNKKEEELSEEQKETLHLYKEEKRKAKHANLANKIQMIFQDPIASLNPRMTVRNIIAEGLIIQGCHDKEFINQEVARVLKLVGLVPEHANRYPHEFSGGQRQRIGIARAVIMNPELIVADEPVSALDVSVQAQVINLLNELRNNLGLTIIFIAHNLSVVKYFCDRIAVMYFGNLVEVAPSDELFLHPLHPYTRSLLSAVPCPDPITEATRTRILYNPSKEHDYSKQSPTFREIVPGHFVRCNDEEEARYLKELEGKK